MPDYPEDLDHPFRRGDLSLLQVGWREVAGPLWRSPFRGVHVWSVTDEAAARQRALDASLLLPAEGALGGWAAAQVAGVAELDGQQGGREPVLVCLPERARVRRGAGVRPLRSALSPDDVTTVDGIRVTTPVRTAFDLARTSSGLWSAVIALDVLARGNPDLLDQVACYANDRPRWRGVPLVRRAAALASPRSRSSGETQLRLLWVLECHLPPPVVNPLILTGDGVVLGMVDLLDPETGTAGEYDGAHHLTARQRATDQVRDEGLRRPGLTVVRANRVDVGPESARTKHRLLDAYRQGSVTGESPRDWYWIEGPLPPPTPLW